MSHKRFNAQIAQYKTPTSEGNGGVTWDGGVKCYLPSATIYGLCSQASGVQTIYGNKNIFDKSLFADGYCLGGYYPGTSNSTYGDRVCSIGNNLIEVNPSTTYTISVDADYPYRIAFVEYSIDKALVFDHGWKTANTITFTTYPNTKYLWIVTSSNSYSTSITVDEILSYNWQIEEGSVATSYVPHSTESKQVPYPSPDLPSPIKYNSGTFSAYGRNLLPSFQEIYANLTLYNEGGYQQYVFHVPPNTPVTICSPHEKDTGKQFYMYVLPDTTGTYGGPWMYHPTDNYYQKDSVTITAGEDGIVKLIGYGWKIPNNEGFLNDNLWAVIGDQPLPYEPHFDGGGVLAPDLYGIPNTHYIDEWNATTGRGIRRCAIIQNYSGETINTSYISTTGGLDTGATVVYGIPDTPFYSEPTTKLIQPNGYGTLIQTAGDIPNCPVSVKYLTHS